jgi:hypothetical protein
VAQYGRVAQREGGKQRENHDCETIDTAWSFQSFLVIPTAGVARTTSP